MYVTATFYHKVFLLILFVSTFIFTGCSSQSTEEKQINVVFRFDDPSSRSSTETELRVIDAFREHNASITFGIIPFMCAGNVNDISPQDVVPLGQKKGELLKKATEEGVLDISLHGYSHQTRDAVNKGEFRGLDYDSQLEKLSKGKKLLKEMTGISVTAFVPPWNQYDLNTIKALKVLGFSTLSAAIPGKAPNNSNLNFLPCTSTLSDLRDAVKEARVSLDRQPLIVVLFHEYDFREASKQRGIFSFSEFYDLLSWLKSQKDVQILSVSQASKEIRDLSAKRLQLTNQNFSLEVFLPSFLKESEFLYQESPQVEKTIAKIALLYSIITVFGIVFSYIIGCLIFPKSVNIMKITTFGNTIITAVIILYAIRDLHLHFKETVGIAIFISISIGSWICFHKERQRSKQ